MDISPITGDRNKNWAETMINLEARKLISEANRISALHLKDSWTRMQFANDIKAFIEQQLAIATYAKSDKEYLSCIKNLKAEITNLLDQHNMLQMKTAKLYAKIEFIKENNQTVGYIITAVNVVLSGLEIAGGIALFGTMTPLGMLAGATLIMDGMNGISKEINNKLLSKKGSEGAFADGAIMTAEFMGFSKKTGLATYRGLSLAANVYGVFGLLRRPGTWRLFHYIQQDYFRKINTFSKPKLTMKIVGYGLKAKVVFDLITTDNSND